MKLGKVQARIRKLEKKLKEYPQSSLHMEEDQLVQRFIKAIAENRYSTIEEVKDIAKEITKVFEMDFDRYYD